jgi:hypothetical protein
MDIYGISFSNLAFKVSKYTKLKSNCLYTYVYIGTVGLEKHKQLSPTQSAVFQLMKPLPYRAYKFTLFCDNLFGDPSFLAYSAA